MAVVLVTIALVRIVDVPRLVAVVLVCVALVGVVTVVLGVVLMAVTLMGIMRVARLITMMFVSIALVSVVAFAIANLPPERVFAPACLLPGLSESSAEATRANLIRVYSKYVTVVSLNAIGLAKGKFKGSCRMANYGLELGQEFACRGANIKQPPQQIRRSPISTAEQNQRQPPVPP